MLQKKRIFKIVVYLTFFSGLFMTVLLAILFADIPFGRLDEYLEAQEDRFITASGPTLERDSIILKEHLTSYLLFSDSNIDLRSWYQERLEKKELAPFSEEKGGSVLLVGEDIALKPPYKNNCDKLYCFQKRIKFDYIPALFWKGLMGIEDYRFLDHIGVDFKSILRAIVKDLYEMRLAQGASTLTQQLVRNLFLSNEKSFVRKIKEVFFSIYIDWRFSKEQILEAYFNEAYWGVQQGILLRGIYAASVFYFGRPPQYISSYEVAILISMLKGPNYYDPKSEKGFVRLQERAKVVFKRLEQMHLFPSEEGGIWSEKEWNSWGKKIVANDDRRPLSALWQITSAEYEHLNSFEAYVFVDAAKVTLRRALERIKKEATHDISVKAIVGKVAREDVSGGEKIENERPFIYYSKEERDKFLAIFQEPHQVGSTLKPVVYDVFLQHGKKFSDLVSMGEITLKLKSGSWSPREAHEAEMPEVTLKEALLNSYNRPVITLAQEIGFENVQKILINYVPSLSLPLAEFPAQLLGAVELSVGDVFKMYSKFVSEKCIERGEVFSEAEGEEESVLKILSDPTLSTTRRVVDGPMRDMRFFGKTGTSNNGNDNWYIFFDGKNLGVIWVGVDGAKSSEDLKLFGSSTAFSIFQQFSTNRGKRFEEMACQ
ncbi:MAG: hypothetical protein A2504_06645 [Bdellovibrionales bacterium RIFOXYD12_FULL_39_22]|nr:MAG: hypothetical protein A2385_08965 [Bdellovibrionales bacterium RIFOXYB1_FULL_39_21]OFZ45169.1 MAG: hypothetical protein A2485_05570 [Bdellovibrionales bacterium RIFOXYC12_FULL_39_17]OFZ45639.1 MAG: hypothetical protein A2404_03545 [Bdellovibrionales bacterium RIFOXYC1_FULL_39_130]OFZ68171.1 MAG: hypothetical protein A2451_03030 [Bdellovibrionales bacterium RIFOXYC2_FULL_39_8]OFZ77501.1 MAG: hypothetical protein A2560_09135 [Bdellovibrionales bacterium RIFOXYD1_FULL_39_84]OFZ91630.1 MAG: